MKKNKSQNQFATVRFHTGLDQPSSFYWDEKSKLPVYTPIPSGTKIKKEQHPTMVMRHGKLFTLPR